MRGYSAIGLINPKTPANVGSALRAAANFGSSLIVLQGPRFKKSGTDTQKAYRHVPLIEASNLLDVVPYDCILVAVEITDDASDIRHFQHPERAFYIFGPEDGSVPNTTLSKCPLKIKIPTKRCLNLGVTVAVVLYDRMAKRQG